MRTFRAMLAVAVLIPALAIADVVVPVDSVENFVNVRAEMDSDSMVIGRLRQGSSMPHLGSESGWHKVDLDGGASGYISADWTIVLADSVTGAGEDEDGAVPESEMAAVVPIETATEAATETATETAAEIVTEMRDAIEATEMPPEKVAAAVESVETNDAEVAAVLDQAAANVSVSQGPPGPPGPPGPAGPPGPPGIGSDGAGLEGDENFLVKFSKPTVGGSSQIFDDGRNIGIGTVEPKQRLEVNGSIQIHEQNSSVAGLMITQSSGDTGYIMHNRASTLTIGAGSVDRITIDRAGNVGIGQTEPNHPIEMGSGAHVTAGGVWTNSSSRAKKENVQTLSPEEALQALASLEPVMFNYKLDRGDQHVGFIAEDVPDLVASRDRKGLSAMDIVAVLTRVVQQQQRQIEALERRLAE